MLGVGWGGTGWGGADHLPIWLREEGGSLAYLTKGHPPTWKGGSGRLSDGQTEWQIPVKTLFFLVLRTRSLNIRFLT